MENKEEQKWKKGLPVLLIGLILLAVAGVVRFQSMRQADKTTAVVTGDEEGHKAEAGHEADEGDLHDDAGHDDHEEDEEGHGGRDDHMKKRRSRSPRPK